MDIRVPFVIAQAAKGGGAAKAGLQPGDTLIAFNGVGMRYFDEYQQAFSAHKGEQVNLGIARDSGE